MNLDILRQSVIQRFNSSYKREISNNLTETFYVSAINILRLLAIQHSGSVMTEYDVREKALNHKTFLFWF